MLCFGLSVYVLVVEFVVPESFTRFCTPVHGVSDRGVLSSPIRFCSDLMGLRFGSSWDMAWVLKICCVFCVVVMLEYLACFISGAADLTWIILCVVGVS